MTRAPDCVSTHGVSMDMNGHVIPGLYRPRRIGRRFQSARSRPGGLPRIHRGQERQPRKRPKENPMKQHVLAPPSSLVSAIAAGGSPLPAAAAQQFTTAVTPLLDGAAASPSGPSRRRGAGRRGPVRQRDARHAARLVRPPVRSAIVDTDPGKHRRAERLHRSWHRRRARKPSPSTAGLRRARSPATCKPWGKRRGPLCAKVRPVPRAATR